MKSLNDYINEGIFDVDDNIENFDKSLTIGGSYTIDVNDIRCTCPEKIFKLKLSKHKLGKSFTPSPKVNKFEPKINMMVEKLCEIILNLPIKCIDEHESFCELDPILSPYMKSNCSNPYISKNIGGDVRFHVYCRKQAHIKNGYDIKIVTPNIYIPLIKMK